jgi:aspartyl aminopeptidase
MMLYPSSPEAAVRFLKFVNASPTPFHAVHNATLRLEKAGFQKVSRSLVQCQSAIVTHVQSKVREKDDWEKDVKPGGKYYFTR